MNHFIALRLAVSQGYLNQIYLKWLSLTGEDRHSSRAFLLSIAYALAALFTSLVGIYQSYPTFPWHALSSICAVLVYSLIASFCAFLSAQKNIRLAGNILIIGLMATMPVPVFTLNKIGLLLGLVLILDVSLAAYLFFPASKALPYVLLSMLEAGLLFLADLFWPWERFTVSNSFQLMLPTGIMAFLFALVLARQFPRYSIRLKLILLFLAGTLIPLSVLAYLNLNSLQGVLLKDVGTNIQGIANSRAVELQGLLEQQMSILNVLSENNTLKEEIYRANRSHPGDTAAIYARIHSFDRKWVVSPVSDPLVRNLLANDASQELLEYQPLSPDQVELFVTDRFGALVGATQKTTDFYQADEDWWQKAWNGGQGDLYVGEPVFDENTRKLALDFAVPILGPRREPIGVLRITYDLARIERLIDTSVFGETGITHLVSKNGETIFPENPEYSISASPPASAAGDNFAEVRCGAVVCISNQARVGLPRGAFASEEIAALDWKVVVLQQRFESLIPVEVSRRSAVLLAVGLIGLFSLVGLRAARSLADPIVQLNESVLQMRNGDLSVRTQVSAPFIELNQLGSAFNLMAESIEQRVIEQKKAEIKLSQAYDTTLEGWSRALDLRDKETEGHTERVTEMAVRLARSLGSFSDTSLVHIRRGALLHDIGKMGIPDKILLKPGPLSEDEWVIMRKHPVYAYELLSPIGYLQPALDIPHFHHEKWDGSGYPLGLAGEAIPLAARVFAVVDVWDALRSDRPYRPTWTDEEVRSYLKAQAGYHFDPRIVEVFLQLEW